MDTNEPGAASGQPKEGCSDPGLFAFSAFFVVHPHKGKSRKERREHKEACFVRRSWSTEDTEGNFCSAAFSVFFCVFRGPNPPDSLRSLRSLWFIPIKEKTAKNAESTKKLVSYEDLGPRKT